MVRLCTKRVDQIDHLKTGKLCRDERVLRRFSMNLIASKMQLSSCYLSELETGKRKWNQELIDQFNDALDGKPLRRKPPMQTLLKQKVA